MWRRPRERCFGRGRNWKNKIKGKPLLFRPEANSPFVAPSPTEGGRIDRLFSGRVGVVADDLTGAGDVALAFEAAGLTTEIGIPAVGGVPPLPGPEVRVWILDTESRGLPPHRAARAVRRAVGALSHWKPAFFFKKIDSTLRGPVGAETAAFMDSLFPKGNREPVPFVPAFPKMGRTTVNGRHFVDGVPLHQTPFGKDPVHPIRTHVLAGILAASWPSGSQRRNEKSRECVREGVRVWAPDVESDREMVSVARKVLGGRAAVGSAGFAAVLARGMGGRKKVRAHGPVARVARGRTEAGSVGVVVGSAHPMAGRQLERLKNFLPKAGVWLMERPLRRGSPGRVLRRLAAQARSAERRHKIRRWVVTGGETAFALARFWKEPRWRVAGSIEPGVALCRSMGRPARYLVLKPGGFGSLDVLLNAVRRLLGKEGLRGSY